MAHINAIVFVDSRDRAKQVFNKLRSQGATLTVEELQSMLGDDCPTIVYASRSKSSNNIRLCRPIFGKTTFDENSQNKYVALLFFPLHGNKIIFGKPKKR